MNLLLQSADYNNTPATRTTTSADDAGLIIPYLELFVGIGGTLANALILAALSYRKHTDKKAKINLLIINQISLDLCACITLIVTSSSKISKDIQ